MKHKLLKVKTPNKMLFIKGKLSRTPLEAIVKFQHELDLILSSINQQDLEYEVIDYVEEKPAVIKHEKNLERKKVEIKKQKPSKTILENITNE